MNFIFALGILLFVGYWGGKLIRKVRLPEITGYIIAGVIIGPSCLRLIPIPVLEESLSPVIDIALGLIAFLIGGSLNFGRIKKLHKSILWVTITQGLFAFVVVTFVVILFAPSLVSFAGVETENAYIEILPIALLLGAIASATAPGASIAVVDELKSRGPLTSTLLAVVALDDALAIILFGLSYTLVSQSRNFNTIFVPFIEILGSIGLGILAGLCLRLCSRFLTSTPEHLIVAFGMVCLTYGVSIYFKISPLLSNMASGFFIANSTRRDQRYIAALHNFTPPIYAAFFALSGTYLRLRVLVKVGLVGIAVIFARALGKVAGVSVGGKLARSSSFIKKYLGLALLPQAGVAVGLALILGQNPHLEIYEDILINIVLASVAVNELAGPPLTALVLRRSGETSKKSEGI